MGIIETVKEALNLIQKADNIELYSKIEEIRKQIELLQEENKSLKEEIKILKDHSSTQNKLVSKEDMYYLIDGAVEKGPYCTRCWDADKKLVLMHSCNSTNSEYICPEDHTKIRTTLSYEEEKEFYESIYRMNFN